MIFTSQGRERFLDAVSGFETAVREQDADRSPQAFQELHRRYREADEHEIEQAAPRLAALLPAVPPGPRGVLAVVVGACVERGADPVPCAPHVFDGLAGTLADAATFCERWAATGGGDLPDPDAGDPEPGVVERTGWEAAQAWWTLPQWEMASVAMLQDRAVRTGLDTARRTELLRALSAVEECSGRPFKCLAYALLVLDDEPLVVVHRRSGTGYALRMHGIGDNFQLHTLLADVLVGGGHLPGRAPSAQEAAVCRDAPGQVPTTGSFNLVSPDGEWIWNEGTPSDIPVVDGVRLLVLDPPPYERGWPAGRFFPGMTGDLVLERVLDAEESARWAARCAPPRTPAG
ncbi:hypothetical protein [Streptomyces mexicanus]|jgi:hypothetical protein|uniref:Uncharacterized protein n=1 Tax=Streptomyces mexicanus TaxID=178566 RepID=A0A7X1LT41_9ACTN|nr:hypothetical protein [Streptomyces mexicanus]MBC2868342.1 hypothetical protein [Streptomyces mexicanus]